MTAIRSSAVDAQYGLLFGLREHAELPTSELACLADLSPATATQRCSTGSTRCSTGYRPTPEPRPGPRGHRRPGRGDKSSSHASGTPSSADDTG
jgi:hypothetical protein